MGGAVSGMHVDGARKGSRKGSTAATPRSDAAPESAHDFSMNVAKREGDDEGARTMYSEGDRWVPSLQIS